MHSTISVPVRNKILQLILFSTRLKETEVSQFERGVGE
jgi:hypothetical protein